MDYPSLVQAWCSLLEYPIPDDAAAATATPTGIEAFDTVIPRAIEYTELRMQRDLDFLTTTTTTSGTMTANQRSQDLPTSGGIYIICTQVSLVISGVKQPPLEPVTRDFLDYAWPDDASLGSSVLPVQWCPDNQSNVLVGPAPASALAFSVVGTTRITPLSDTAPENFMTIQLPDLYLAASMVFWAGYQANYGAQSGDPAQALSWETQYKALLSSAQVEEARKNFANMYPSPSNPSGLTAKSQGN